MTTNFEDLLNALKEANKQKRKMHFSKSNNFLDKKSVINKKQKKFRPSAIKVSGNTKSINKKSAYFDSNLYFNELDC